MIFKHSKLIAATVPLFTSLIAIFVTYHSIYWYFGLLFATLALVVILIRPIAIRQKNLRKKLEVILPFLLIFVGSIGMAAAVNLTREKIELLQNPDYVTPCSISPVVACSPIIGSAQASAFGGIPNPILGVFGFGALIIAGMSLLAGGAFKKWWWQALWLGTAFGAAFCMWLIWQSLYSIGALCLFCISVWLMVIPTFLYVTLYASLIGAIKTPVLVKDYLEKNMPVAILTAYLIIAFMIYFKFQEYWLSLL